MLSFFLFCVRGEAWTEQAEGGRFSFPGTAGKETVYEGIENRKSEKNL